MKALMVKSCLCVSEKCFMRWQLKLQSPVIVELYLERFLQSIRFLLVWLYNFYVMYWHNRFQIGHVLRVEFQCQNCRRKLWWASSRMFGGRYLIIQKLVQYMHVSFMTVHTQLLYVRLVHAFTCAGMNTSQYICFCDFAGIGIVGTWYIRSGMHNHFPWIIQFNVCRYLL